MAQTWLPLGPIGSPACNGCNHYYGTGRAEAIAFDPSYTTNHTMYMGSSFALVGIRCSRCRVA
ncbi:MAG: hypothetical protein H0W62_15005 [Chitinophagales bacterium]|nr:hypothetical protein [Chitinophagales bacterium]